MPTVDLIFFPVGSGKRKEEKRSAAATSRLLAG